MSISPNALVPVALGCFVAWRISRRIRRHIGQQPFQPRRIKARILLYTGIVVLIAGASALANPSALVGVGGGLLLGAGLALIGLRLTIFETTPQGHFYTPNTAIGVCLAVLLVGRVIYRITALYAVSLKTGPQSANFAQSPLTLLFFGLVFGYYIAYYAGVLARGGRQKSISSQSAGATSQL